MATERELYRWHLTPKGWVPGDEPPEDRVETWLLTVTSHDVYPSISKHWSGEWKSPHHSEEDRSRLRERFREPTADYAHSVCFQIGNFPLVGARNSLGFAMKTHAKQKRIDANVAVIRAYVKTSSPTTSSQKSQAGV